MKRIAFFVILSALIIFASLSCEKKSVRSGVVLSEENAINTIAVEIHGKNSILKGKKIGIFDFTTIEGKETKDGRRLSKKLLEVLIKKGGLRFIERSELNKILKAQGIEQTGIVDSDSIKESGKVMSIDIMINGTLARIDDRGEISVKAVDISSGEIYLASTVCFVPKVGLTQKQDPKMLKLHRKSPEKLEIMNKVFFALKSLKKQRPLIFLMATVYKSDFPTIRENNPRLGQALKRRRDNIKNKKPDVFKRIQKLRRGVRLLKEYDTHRYDVIMKEKGELLNRRGSIRPGRRRPRG